MLAMNKRKLIILIIVSILLIAIMIVVIGMLTTSTPKVEGTHLFEYSIDSIDSITLEDHDILVSKTVAEPEQLKDIITLLNTFSYVSTQHNPPAGFGGTSITINGLLDSHSNKFHFTTDSVIFSENSGYTNIYIGASSNYFRALFDILYS